MTTCIASSKYFSVLSNMELFPPGLVQHSEANLPYIEYIHNDSQRTNFNFNVINKKACCKNSISNDTYLLTNSSQ